MLINEGDRRTSAVDIRLAGVLSAAAGAVNAAGFQATGFFSANQTGNVSSMSDHVALGAFGLAALLAALVAVFIVGAFCAGVFIEAGRQRHVRGIYAYCIMVEGGLLLLMGAAQAFLPSAVSTQSLVVGLSFVMGLQNATSTRISGARVRTTHVSGMATDIGLGLAALVSAAPDRSASVDRLRLYGVTIAAFVGGGIGGALAYLAVSSVVFVLVGALLVAVALREASRARRV